MGVDDDREIENGRCKYPLVCIKTCVSCKNSHHKNEREATLGLRIQLLGSATVSVCADRTVEYGTLDRYVTALLLYRTGPSLPQTCLWNRTRGFLHK